MTDIRIATFNLESLDEPPRSERPLSERVRVLRPMLEALNADILCLQEVNGQHVKGERERVLHALKTVLEGTPYAGYRLACTYRHPGQGVFDVHNLVTLSRFPIVSSTEIHHEYVPPAVHHLISAPEPDLKMVTFERPVLLTEIDIGEEAPVFVVNVHFRAPLAAAIPGQKSGPFAWSRVTGWAEGYYLAALKRTGQALETRLVAERIFDRSADARLAIVGDFNAEDHETPLKIVSASAEDTGNAELMPREMHILDREIPHERRFSLRHGGRRLMFDHILASEGLKRALVDIEVLNGDLEDEVDAACSTSGSFHAPVVATFRFSAPRT